MSLAGKKWTQLGIIILSKLRQTQQEKYHVFSLMCSLDFTEIYKIVEVCSINVDMKVSVGEGTNRRENNVVSCEETLQYIFAWKFN